MFETRSHSWRQAGLIRQINPRVVKRARIEALVLAPAFVGVIVVNDHRHSLFGVDMPVRVATVVALLILGWALARDVGRAAGPTLFRRLDPATAGTVGFVARLVTAAVALLIALRTAGIDPRTLAVGGAFTAVIFGLAAQQTLGNVIAGTVLLSARPFRVGDRVRLQAGGVAGTLEGVVSSLGLLYTTLANGEDLIMVPNSVVLSSAVIPLREPESVDLRARLRPGVTPGDLQERLANALKTPVREPPRITLEELDGDEVVVRISATPKLAADGPALATEVLDVVSAETRGAGEIAAARAGAAPVSPADGAHQARRDSSVDDGWDGERHHGGEEDRTRDEAADSESEPTLAAPRPPRPVPPSAPRR